LLGKLSNSLKSWYEVFIKPIEAYLPENDKEPLVFVPEGLLSLIPFAVLKNADEQYLIEKYPILMAPSIQTLCLLDSIPAPASEKRLIIGNPKTTDRDLPYASIEANEVSKLLLGVDKPLIQEEARLSSIMGKLQTSPRWIHFACHGIYNANMDPHSLFTGCLKFVHDDIYPDGNLYAEQVAKMKLNAELVFMSACSSGIGRISQEGSIGQVWSFLAAGAKSTVATLWSLPDSSLTVEMVTEFYCHILGTSTDAQLLGKPLSKVEALRKVILKAIGKMPDSPDLWGAFFLSGLPW